MGFFDNAQEVLDKGVSVAKGAVSGVAVEQQAFVKAFVRLCSDGWLQGWHERNGGNLSYRLAPEDIASCRSFFYDNPSSWVPVGIQAENLGGEFFMVTAAGAHLRNVPLDPDATTGIVEINPSGDAWRIVWGFKDGAVPTSEFPGHFAIQSARKTATNGASRALYHAHPASIVALTQVLPLDARTFTRALWTSFSESMVAFPQGIGVVPWTVPGGVDAARTTAEQMSRYEACVWAHHGVFASGASFDAAFGLMHTIEKAASIYASARAMNGGSDAFPNAIPDGGLRAIAEAYGLQVNEGFLD